MNILRFLHPVRILWFLSIVMLIGGCSSQSQLKLQFTPDAYQKLHKYPIRIRLELSDDYRNVKVHDGKVIPIGADLTRYSTILAEQIFDLVSDSTSPNSGENIDAVLVPEILSINHQRKMWAGQEARIMIIQKWTLKDSSGKPIWIQTVTGVGVMGVGTAFSEGTREKERAQLAIDDLFTKSAEEMSSSVEIRKFGEKVALDRK